MNIIRDVIADAVNEDRRSSYGNYIPRGGIKVVEFRKGCAEIEVEFYDKAEWDSPGEEYTSSAIIDAAPVLSALLTWAIEHSND
jgi:hypothetical protein